MQFREVNQKRTAAEELNKQQQQLSLNPKRTWWEKKKKKKIKDPIKFSDALGKSSVGGIGTISDFVLI